MISDDFEITVTGDIRYVSDQPGQYTAEQLYAWIAKQWDESPLETAVRKQVEKDGNV